MTAGKVRWGVLGAARIATEKVVPAMQRGRWSTVTAIASRDLGRAQGAAETLGIPKAYGSYDALLADSNIDAVYVPLPNHLHVPWTIRAAEHGKHVLCEKPIALTAAEASTLVDVRDRTGMKIQEAFMIRAHPQWPTAVDLVGTGRLGELRSFSAAFSYSNARVENIRNIREFGGGALLDIGCYLVHAARWIVGREPDRVASVIDRDPTFGTDRLTSMVLDFGDVQATGTCSTQQVPSQRVEVFGTRARLDIEIPFNAPTDRNCYLHIDDGARPGGAARESIELSPCDQYTLQGDVFSRAILEDHGQALPLEDSVANMRVIDAVFRAAETGRWERPSASPGMERRPGSGTGMFD